MKAGLATFGELGPGPGEIAHYIAADGSGGYVISENDSIDEVHERILRYTHMLDFEIVPILTVDQAVPVAMKVFG